MRRLLPVPRAAALAALLSVAVLPAAAQSPEESRVKDAAQVFQALVAIPEHQVPEELMRGAVAVAIFPNVRRVGLVIGGQRGQGVLVVRDESGAWSRPVFLTLNGASVGWQVGLQSADIVLFFHTRATVERVLLGTTTLGVDASLAAGSLGRSAAAVTDTDLAAEIYSYARTRGIFAGVALQGSVLSVDDAALDAYYRARRVGAEDVIAGAGLPMPADAATLVRVLGDYEKSIR
jgi:lipid-binding SYLF domain-containing protein